MFADPLTVDFERAPNPHIVFASGFHRCLGSHLARMEMHIALDARHRRIPDYVVTPAPTSLAAAFPAPRSRLSLACERAGW